MDIQYREYSMQNEYTIGCILFKKFIYLQSYAWSDLTIINCLILHIMFVLFYYISCDVYGGHLIQLMALFRPKTMKVNCGIRFVTSGYSKK